MAGNKRLSYWTILIKRSRSRMKKHRGVRCQLSRTMGQNRGVTLTNLPIAAAIVDESAFGRGEGSYAEVRGQTFASNKRKPLAN